MRFLVSLFLSSICFACSSDSVDNVGFSTQSSSASLTEQKITNYLKLFNQLKEQVPEVLELVNENESTSGQQEQFNKLEKIIQENGMNYQEFVEINSKIGTVYSVSEANMESYQEMKDANQDQMQDVVNSIQEMIDDPDVPEDKKAELRLSLKQAQTGKKKLGSMFEQNRKKAAKMYKKIQKKLGKLASQQEIALVNKYQKEIEQAYQGIARPRIVGSL